MLDLSGDCDGQSTTGEEFRVFEKKRERIYIINMRGAVLPVFARKLGFWFWVFVLNMVCYLYYQS